MRGTLTEIKKNEFDASEIAKKSSMGLDASDYQRIVLQSEETLQAHVNETGQIVEFLDCIGELYKPA